MIDPLRRWSEHGYKPDYAGLLTYSALPYTEDPGDLEGVDVAIVGAPMDELVSDRPGARNGPRAIRAASTLSGPDIETGVDALEELTVIDFGDAAVIPADPVRSHAAIEETVGAVVGAGALPIVLGGDHSIAEPDVRAAAGGREVGMIHFDTHTDTWPDVLGATLSHGTPMRHLVEAGVVAPSRYVQIGIRGHTHEKEVWAWQREQGITTFPMHEVRDRGIGPVVAEAIARVGAGPAFLSVDVDVLDPAFAPGTGTPEPGGMTSLELLQGCREVAASVDLVGADVVEVAPEHVGARDITAQIADRVVREILTGIALRRRGRGDQPS